MSDLTCSPPICAALPDRALLRISGPDASGFLNPLVSSDVAAVGGAAYAALLTPQGKFLHDFLIYTETADSLLVDVATDRRADLKRRLTLYRLRAKVELAELDGWQGFALFGSGQAPEVDRDAVLFVDPRLPALGWRLWLPAGVVPPLTITSSAVYEAHRIGLGVPDGVRDIEIDKGLLLENHFEALHGVDFRKGCYIGQELTARTKYRGLLKKQLYKVTGAADLPAPGTPITANGQEVGQLRSVSGSSGLALLRLDAVSSQELDTAGVALTAIRPDYAGPVPEAKS
ncbi:folate-binding protein YgfZ [Ferrovibrio terrae]|uniref:Folate-binding protein YgfZ n=1 Tax=Ferrovibrio terrae TaxID=2594003 RepID=A0A516GYV7_9PROT|nr:folate-binding protein YgfZ [Ferrovibrio terrae]QDO96530.1 folate-binding protein YgfZ [Ferrovibrio terrae]